jgi:hypothetical protein
LDEVVGRLGEKVALGLFAATPTKQRNNATQSNANSVANSKEAHLVFIGLQKIAPSVEIRMALTLQPPDVPVGILNGMGVKAGIGVLAVVATAPSPTST